MAGVSPAVGSWKEAASHRALALPLTLISTSNQTSNPGRWVLRRASRTNSSHISNEFQRSTTSAKQRFPRICSSLRHAFGSASRSSFYLTASGGSGIRPLKFYVTSTARSTLLIAVETHKIREWTVQKKNIKFLRFSENQTKK